MQIEEEMIASCFSRFGQRAPGLTAHTSSKLSTLLCICKYHHHYQILTKRVLFFEWFAHDAYFVLTLFAQGLEL
jgi:hypothetical protein